MNKYLSFEIKNQLYLFDIEDVNSIIEKHPDEISRVPDTPKYFLGITQLREKTISVIDSNLFLNKEKVGTNGDLSIIIINQESDKLYGIAVDRVLGVLEIPKDSLAKKDSIFDKINPYIKGVYQDKENIQLIIDVKYFNRLN